MPGAVIRSPTNTLQWQSRYLNPRNLSSNLVMLLCGDKVDHISKQRRKQTWLCQKGFFFSEKVTNKPCPKHFETIV